MSTRVQEINYFDTANFTDSAPDAAGTGGTWKHHPALEGVTKAPTVNTDGAQRRNRRGQSTSVVVTNKLGALGLTSQLHGGTLCNDGAAGDTPPSGCYLQELLANYWGAAPTNFGGTTVKAGNTGTGTTLNPLELTTTVGLSVGDFIQCGSERRCVIAKPGADTVVLDRALTVAANYAPAAVVYGSYSFSVTLGEYRYIWMLAKMSEHTHLYGPGHIVSLALQNIVAAEGLRLAMEYQADGFQTPGYTDPTTFEDAISKFSGNPLVALGAPIAINGVETDCISADVNFGVTHQWKRATKGTNGRGGAKIVGCNPTGNITTYWSSTIRGYYEDQTKIPIFIDVPGGSTNIGKARNSACVYAPNCQIKIANDDGSDNEQNVIPFSWVANDPEAESQTNLLTKSIYFGIFGGRAA